LELKEGADMAFGTETVTSQNAKRPGREMPRDRVQMGMGLHLLVEMWQSPFATLADARVIEQALDRVGKTEAGISGGPEADVRVYQFSPYGVSGTATTTVACIVIHTWPENKYAAVDIYASGRENAYRLLEEMRVELQPESVYVTELHRGRLMEMEDT
jgi:S-adenosylmethionine decarboxylase